MVDPYAVGSFPRESRTHRNIFFLKVCISQFFCIHCLLHECSQRAVHTPVELSVGATWSPHRKSTKSNRLNDSQQSCRSQVRLCKLRQHCSDGSLRLSTRRRLRNGPCLFDEYYFHCLEFIPPLGFGHA